MLFLYCVDILFCVLILGAVLIFSMEITKLITHVRYLILFAHLYVDPFARNIVLVMNK
jgi:hypothetical protein